MTNIERLIKIAADEVGYCEKKTESDLDSPTANAGGNNFTKYARDLDAVEYFNLHKQGFEWCAVFVCWCFYQLTGHDRAKTLAMLYNPTSGNCAAGCTWGMRYFKENGALFDDPKVGDVVFFGNNGESNHTGIVIGTGNRLKTIEGNSSNKVSINEYRSVNVIGYGRPRWDLLADPVDEPVVEPKEEQKEDGCGDVPVDSDADSESDNVSGGGLFPPTLKYLDTSTAVGILQRELIHRGYSVGRYKDDGEFGNYTLLAVKRFQKAHDLPTDGIVGINTWRALFAD